MKHTTDEARKNFEKLPDVLKAALFDPEVANKIFEVGKKYGLTIEKTGFLAEETGHIILGLTHPNEFTDTLKNRLGVDGDDARDIALDISHQVFFPLREALKDTHHIDIKEEALQAPPASIAKPSVPPAPTITPPPQKFSTVLPSQPPHPSSPPPQPVRKPPAQPIDLRAPKKFTPEPPHNIPLINLKETPELPPAPTSSQTQTPTPPPMKETNNTEPISHPMPDVPVPSPKQEAVPPLLVPKPASPPPPPAPTFPQQATPAPPAPPTAQPPPIKTTPSSGTDPYREPVE